jgi:Ca-activated chloride channel family protein
MTSLSFGSPVLLVVAAGWLGLAGWSIGRELRRRERSLATYGDQALLAVSSAIPATRHRRAELVLRMLALALGLIALARPQWGERPAALADARRDVLVLLDLSRSMNATDDSVPRLTLAKRAVADVLAAAPETRVGLIVFGGSAFLQLPLTSNHAAFRRFLDAATTDDLGDPSTSLAGALTAAATTFEHEGERGYGAVLLASDGESTRDDVGPMLVRLRKAGVPVFAIGVGSPEGASVPADTTEAPEKWHRDNIGRVVLSRLEEGDLRRAALETNGVYARWSPASPRSLGRELAHLEKRAVPSQTSWERIDRFQWPAALAILALLLAPLVSALPRRSRVSRLLLAVGFVSSASYGCSPAMRDLRRGEQRYQDGRYREAYQAYHRAFTTSGDPALQFAAGSALYRLRRYEDAARSFKESSAVPRLRQPSYYNLGNAYVRAAEEASEPGAMLRQAITAYEEALRLEPADSAAKWNLELALRRRGEDRLSGGSPGRGRSADYGRGNMDDPGYEGNPEAAVGAMAGGGYGAGEGESAEELSESQARQLLEAIEREQLRSHQGRRSSGAASGEKDW